MHKEQTMDKEEKEQDMIPAPVYFEPDLPEWDVNNLLIEMGKNKTSKTLFRDDLITEIYSILISEKKPNALLVGPAGCGKTDIVEEIAKRISEKSKDVPQVLYGYNIYSMNLSDIVSGCSLVGDLERKVRKLVDHIESEDHKVILFLDEVHMLFGGESYKKVAQIIKPALSRGKFMVIAATTTQEVKKIDEDPAFNRRFTRVLVDEMNPEQTRIVLQKTVKAMEKHYGREIAFDPKVADLIVRTADEFCTVGSHRPDNAITLMDRAIATRVINLQMTNPDAPVILDEKLVQETAFRITSGNSVVKKFDEEKFRKAASKIHGQDDVVNAVAKRLRLYDLHLRPRNKSLTFLFAGPSGVGKTEIAKIIAREYLGEKPIVLNMAEYHSAASINRIIGAPAGYSGADSNRELPFDLLDTNPYQVILLDEFEKCDSSVQRLFLSVFEEGTMKTNIGKEIDFSKSIIIATTNAGCTDASSPIGFSSDYRFRNLTTLSLSKYFDVEILNRFSDRYTFHEIKRQTYKMILRDIMESEIKELEQGRLGPEVKRLLSEAVTEETIEQLAEKTYDANLGARPAKAAVEEYIDSILLNVKKE